MLCLMLWTNVVSAAELERLFTTPGERIVLDRVRQTAPAASEKNLKDPEISKEVAIPAPSSISVEGYIVRKDGQPGTIWINQQPMQEGSQSKGVAVGKIGTGRSIPIAIPENGFKAQMKPGEKQVIPSSEILTAPSIKTPSD